jgi:uncharacterized protein YegP (UPF0339 family)
MPGKFVLERGRTGKFRFSLRSTNGKVVLTSETYESKRAARDAIATIQRLAPEAVMVDTTIDDGATTGRETEEAAPGHPNGHGKEHTTDHSEDRAEDGSTDAGTHDSTQHNGHGDADTVHDRGDDRLASMVVPPPGIDAPNIAADRRPVAVETVMSR